jgi:hypothetical protein
MATALAVQKALAGHNWGNDPDIDYENRLAAIACVAIEDLPPGLENGDLQWLGNQVRRFDGVFVDAPWPAHLVVFANMMDAMNWASGLQKHFAVRTRIGVNLAEFLATPEGRPDAASLFARNLMEQSEPGGMCVSAVVEERMTSRLRAADFETKSRITWFTVFLFVLQVSGLLAYFLAWYYGIFWKTSTFAKTGSYVCWPQWLCG